RMIIAEVSTPTLPIPHYRAAIITANLSSFVDKPQFSLHRQFFFLISPQGNCTLTINSQQYPHAQQRVYRGRDIVASAAGLRSTAECRAEPARNPLRGATTDAKERFG